MHQGPELALRIGRALKTNGVDIAAAEEACDDSTEAKSEKRHLQNKKENKENLQASEDKN